MKEKTITYFKDGAVIRLHNRRMIIFNKKDSLHFVFQKYEKGDKPTAVYSNSRGKKEVQMGISKELASGLIQVLNKIINNEQ